MRRTVFDAEHELFRESVSTFVSRELMPNRERFREKRSIDREFWRAAGEQGLLGLSVPERYGGAGVDDFRFNAVLSEELTRAGLAYSGSVSVHVDIVAPYLTDLATEEQRTHWLPGFCSGELITAIAMTEPHAGSDLASLRASAVQRGSDWVINGSKTFITNGHNADLFVVAARTEAGISLFAVPGRSAGLVRGRKLNKIGQHEADTAEIFLEDLRLPAEGLLGEEGAGFRYMMERLAQERLATAVGNVAHAAFALEQTLEYARTRYAFGRPIGSFQNSRFRIAELSTEIDVTQAYVDRCLQAKVDNELSAVDAAKAKWWSADVQNRALDTCVQLHGGYGYMEEYDVARAWADARITRIWAGTNEIMKEIIGRSLGLGDV